MNNQCILRGSGHIQKTVNALNVKKIFVLHDGSYRFLFAKSELEKIEAEFVYFGDVKPNPLYVNIIEITHLFKDTCCDAIIAIGGGSVIDTAKCVKFYSNSHVPLIAVPATAGTGSESTHFAVMYRDGEKQSVASESILPAYAILIPEMLKTLPNDIKKWTFLDALCQGIESWWSINATEESIGYAKKALEILISKRDAYFAGDDLSYMDMMDGANYAGRAINIAQTTAPHAMSYKLTTLYGLPHGYAVALCLPAVWRYMVEIASENLNNTFINIAQALGYDAVTHAIDGLAALFNVMGVIPPQTAEGDIPLLAASVNPTRLKNSPVFISGDGLQMLYEKILWRQ